MVFETVDGIIGGADDLHAATRHETASRAIGLGKLLASLLPDFVGRLGRQAFCNTEIAGQFELCPVVKRIAQQVGHGRRKGIKLLAIRRRTGDQRLIDAIRAHRAPFVMVAAQPQLSEILPASVGGNVGWWQMTVVINDRQMCGVFVIQPLSRS